MKQTTYILNIGNDNSPLRMVTYTLQSNVSAGAELVIIDRSENGFDSYLKQKFSRWENNVRYIRTRSDIFPWEALQIAVNEATRDIIMFRGTDSWTDTLTDFRLIDTFRDTNVDLLQFSRVRRTRHKYSKIASLIPEDKTNRVIRGDEYHFFTRFVGDFSYVSASIYDKVYRRRILQEALQIDVAQVFAVDEILNIHYLRHGRSLYFESNEYLNVYAGNDLEYYAITGLPTESSKSVYAYKKLAGQDSDCIKEELRNRMMRRLEYMIDIAGWTPEALIYFLRIELNDPVWREVGINNEAEEMVHRLVKNSNLIETFKRKLRMTNIR